MTGGAAAVISRAIASDMYSGNELTKFMALLMLVNGIAPVVAPTIGGIILNYSVYVWSYVILTIFGFVMVIGSLLKVPESLTVTNRESSSGLKTMFKNFKNIIEDATFCITNAHSRYDICNIIYLYFCVSVYYSKNLWHDLQYNLVGCLQELVLRSLYQVNLLGNFVDFIDSQKLMRGMTMIQIIGVILVTIVLLNHWNFWILAIGFII